MRKAVFIGLMVGSACKVLAQEDTAVVTKSLSEVVVSAHRKKTALLQVPYLVETTGKHQVNTYQPRTTPEALIGLNGVFLQKTNHGGGSPFVRGLTGNQVLLLVDGIRLNNSTFRYGPNQYLNTIDPFGIDRIEVAKGTGSVQYGSDALGGVIQVFSREPEFSTDPNWKGNLLGKFMSGGMEQSGHGDLSYSSEKMVAQIGLSYRNFGDLVGGDSTGKQSPSGYSEYAWDAKLKFIMGNGARLTIAHQFLQQQDLPVYHKVVLENFRINHTDPQQRMLNYARLDLDGRHKLARQVSFTTSWQHSVEGRASIKNNGSALRKEKDAINTLGFTAELYSEFSEGWTANSGMEFYHDQVSSARLDKNESTGVIKNLRGLYPDGSRYGNYSIYSLHHINWGRFSSELGARYNFFDIRLSDTSLGKVQLQPAAVVGNAALMFHLTSQHKFFLSVSNGFRAPNIDDMGTLGIVDFRYEVPTNNLKPEKSVNTEIGYKFAMAKLEGSASVYYLHLKDLITRVRVGNDSISGYPVYKKENTEKAVVKGIEFGLKYHLTSQFLLSGNLAYQNGENITKSEPMRRIPPVNGRFMGTYAKKKWHADAEWLWACAQERLAQGDKEDNRIPAGGTPGWNLLNLYGGISWFFADLNFGVQNIFNEDYRTHGSGINGVGRSLWVSMRIKISK